MQCKSLWIKASAKCINVKVNLQARDLLAYYFIQIIIIIINKIIDI